MTATVPSEAGVVYESASTTIIDTREMPWVDPLPGEALHGLPGAKAKVFSRFANGEPRVQFMFVPPALTSYISLDGEPERHYHRTVRECVYLLDGELQFREYQDPAQTEGVPVRYQPGYLLDRRPGSTGTHGVDGRNPSMVGSVSLTWVDAPGANVAGPDEAGTETVVVTQAAAEAAAQTQPYTPKPLPEPAEGVVYQSPTATIFDTAGTPWQDPDPDTAFAGTGAQVKVFARADDGTVLTQMIYWPPGDGTAKDVSAPPVEVKDGFTWVFVLSGEMPILEFRDAEDKEGNLVTYTAGYFLERRPGAGGGHITDPFRASPVGFTCLQFKALDNSHPAGPRDAAMVV